jgi:hypothetical protein
MRTPLEIRNDALDCLRQADRAPARRHKAILLLLAQGFASLAEEMERRKSAQADGTPAPADEQVEEPARAQQVQSEMQSAGAN